jgi:Flp pilus assembly protein TadG
MVSSPQRRVRGAQARDGQGIAEFAIVLPLFLLMLFGIIDIGRVIWAYDDVSNAAREGARYASVHGNTRESDPTFCQTGPNLGATPPSGCPTWSPDSKEPTRIATRTYLIAGGSSAVIQVCYYVTTPCTGNTDEVHATNSRGAFVTVTATSSVPILTGLLLRRSSFGVSATTTSIVNN